MKITFNAAELTETNKSNVEKARSSRQTKSVNAYEVNFLTKADQQWEQSGLSDKNKSKTMVEIQQDASNIDVSIQQDYMTVMSNTMSEEDYAKLQEEGFHFESMDPETAVTIVDKIKAELARSGKCIAGYNDDLDMETLAAAVGSQSLAGAIENAFAAADIPMTEENLAQVQKAWEMVSGLESMTDGSYHYMIDNQLAPEIWNYYLAQNSGTKVFTGGGPKFYAEDIKGYYTESAEMVDNTALDGQIDKVIEQAGYEATEEMRQSAEWLLSKGLPLTEENFVRLTQLQSVSFPVKEEVFATAVADAIAEGKDAIAANLAKAENIYEKAVFVLEYYGQDIEQLIGEGGLTARRQLEEIRLRMTAELNVKLLKSGFAIDTAPMEELLEALKQAEAQIANQYFPGDADAVGKYEVFQQTSNVIQELPTLPAWLLGTWSVEDRIAGANAGTLTQFHAEGKALQANLEQAGEKYETLMTAPRRDLGDSIQKAFANVDDILTDMGLKLSEENQKAIRILAYNRMTMTVQNVEMVRQADEQVRQVIEKMTPAATLKMIRDGVNPLENTFVELENYFDSLPEEYKEEAQSYARFLHGLEKNHEITESERESYIGIYRLIHQIEKSDGAAIGALVNSQAELHFSNLLSAVRSGKMKKFDVKVSEELGGTMEIIRNGKSISEQVQKAFLGTVKEVLTEVSTSEETEKTYRQMELQQIRQAAQAGTDSVAMLQSGQVTTNAENLIAAQALLHDTESFKAFMKKEQEGDNVTSEENFLEKWSDVEENLANKETFREQYNQIIDEMKQVVETMTFEQTDNSVDLRGLQLMHKQLTVMGQLSTNEEYVVPMYIGNALAKVHLSVDKSETAQSSVAITVYMGNEEPLEANIYLENGKLNGVLSGNLQNEVTKLQAIADTFSDEASKEWEVENISIAQKQWNSKTKDNRSIASKDTAKANNAELYRIAKVFLQAVRQ